MGEWLGVDWPQNGHGSPHLLQVLQEDGIKVQLVAIAVLAMVEVINSIVGMGSIDVGLFALGLANLAMCNLFYFGLCPSAVPDLFGGADFFVNCIGLG